MSAKEKIVDPQQLISKQDVVQALKIEKGFDADLLSFEIRDFTQKGDNYACLVSSVQVQYIKEGRKQETSYVTKKNPQQGSENLSRILDFAFAKEIGFYTQVLPLLNNELEKAGESRLRVPRYFHSVETKGEQVIYFEDLRKSGFRLHNRQKAMDETHTELIIKELARLHASSELLQANQTADLTSIFPIFTTANDMNTVLRQILPANFSGSSFEGMAMLTDQIPGYKFVSEFMRQKKPEIREILDGLLKAKEPFRLVSHGDCWNSNFLFRYSATGVPVECRLLDFQVARVGSPALDLNYLFSTSTDGHLRRTCLPHLLTSYYTTFASVLAGTSVPLRFTFLELKKELSSKHMFGLYYGVLIVPMVLLDPENTPKMESFFKGDQKAAYEAYKKEVNKIILKCSNLRPRLLDLFDDMKEYGLFSSSDVSKLVHNFNKRASLKM